MADRPRRRGPVSIEVVPSILSADVGRLAEQVAEAGRAGADRIQVDVMDGHFVPNLTFGPLIVAAVRSATKLPIEAHLMVERPELFVEAVVKAGATLIEVDGGIDARTAPLVVAAGATVLVAGNSVYGFKGGVAAGIKAIRDAID